MTSKIKTIKSNYESILTVCTHVGYHDRFMNVIRHNIEYTLCMSKPEYPIGKILTVYDVRRQYRYIYIDKHKRYPIVTMHVYMEDGSVGAYCRDDISNKHECMIYDLDINNVFVHNIHVDIYTSHVKIKYVSYTI